MTSGTEPRWLDDAEQHAWREFLWGGRLLMAAIDHDLRVAGVQASEYEILSMLSEAPGRSMRMSELATLVVQSRSRLTHAASRLEERGWVLRQPCEEDRRGVLLTLTEDGLQTLVDLAPLHVESVRRHIVDLLTPEQFARLGELMSVVRLAAAADGAGHPDGPATIDP